MKKNDIILCFGILIIACICAIIIQFVVKKDGAKVVITVDGTVYKTLQLEKDTELEIHGINGGMNQLIIKDGQAYMIDADCPDKICVHQGKISKTGETIVCLPHKVVIEIKGNDKQLDEIVK